MTESNARETLSISSQLLQFLELQCKLQSCRDRLAQMTARATEAEDVVARQGDKLRAITNLIGN